MPYLMKGQHWSDRNKGRRPMPYPVLVEPKVDEIRVRISTNLCDGPSDYRQSPVQVKGFLSYAEKPLHNLERFAEMWACISAVFQYSEFDVGFECNGNFNDSYRWVRSSKNRPQELENSEKLFYLFDLPTHGGCYEARRNAMYQIAAYCAARSWPVKVLDARYAMNQEEVEAQYLLYRLKGHEGAMVKQPRHYYAQGKRNRDWLKMKPEETADGKITGIIEAIAGVDSEDGKVKAGDRLGRAGSVEVTLSDGSVATPHGIEHALARRMFHKPAEFLGEWCEFAYMERDRQGGYRHPVFRRLRESKS